MADKQFWKKWLEGNATSRGADAMDEGLSKLAGKMKPKSKLLLIGEEIGNSVTHGVMALFMLGILPYAAIRAYIRAPEGKESLDAFGVSLFIICIFCMFLTSTIYHVMRPGTQHKEVMNRLDHMMIYVAIAGTYTPISLSIVGGAWGIGLTAAQWALVLSGVLFKALAFSKSIKSYIFTISIYLIMGWMVVLCFPLLLQTAAAPAFWLILVGGFFYTSGIICFSLRFPFAHMVWHFFVDLGAISHFIAIVFFLR